MHASLTFKRCWHFLMYGPDLSQVLPIIMVIFVAWDTRRVIAYLRVQRINSAQPETARPPRSPVRETMALALVAVMCLSIPLLVECSFVGVHLDTSPVNYNGESRVKVGAWLDGRESASCYIPAMLASPS